MDIYKHPAMLAALCLACCLSPSSILAQEEMVEIWVSEVQAASDGFSGVQWQIIGRFSSYQSAAACSLGWSNLHPNSLRMTRERAMKVPKSELAMLLENTKEAKEAVDKAKGVLNPKERTLGDTLKEYKKQLGEAFNRAVNAKRELTSMTGNITLKQFNDVNKLIDGFNTQYDEAEKKGWSFDNSGMQRIQRVTPSVYDITAWKGTDFKNEPISFRKEGGKWNEYHQGSQPTDSFIESKRTDGYVELYDASRKMWLRLFPDKVLWTQQGKSDWSLLPVSSGATYSLAQSDVTKEYELWTARYSASSKIEGHYETLAAAREAAKKYRLENLGAQPHYTITYHGQDIEVIGDWDGRGYSDRSGGHWAR